MGVWYSNDYMSETPTPSPELKVPPFWKLLIPLVAARHYLAREKEPGAYGPGNVLVGGLTLAAEVVFPIFSLWLAQEYNSWPAGAGVYIAGRFALAWIAGLK